VRLFASLTIALLVLLGAASARASGCDEQVRSAHAQEASGEVDRALRLYTDAVTVDPTCAAAYLGLGALRERALDLREAERVYSIALEHVPALTDAHARRAGVRFRLGFRDDAVAELRAIADAPLGDEPSRRSATSALRQLATWYGDERQLPAQLACWRRILAVAGALADDALTRESRTMVRALQLLVGPADPVTQPVRPSPLRALVARTASSP
jgi:tetratricopeptide (TPR) repeat protein